MPRTAGGVPATRRLAIVDDNPRTTLLIKSILEGIGKIAIETFTDPRAAIEECRSGRHDLILVDYHMPGMNGIEFLRALRDEDHLCDIPVVMITGEEDKDLLYKALEAGATDFLRKPVEPVELIARVRNMLRLRTRQLELTRANEQLAVMATTDELTRLANRRYILQTLANECERAKRYSRPFSLAMIDVDHFKRVNDSHGHDVGDEVLSTLAAVLVRVFRNVDCVGRLGGEEFAVCLPETDLDGARRACERLRHELAAAPGHARGAAVSVTVSIGLAGYDEDAGTPESLLKRADELLYAAKRKGRDRIEADGAAGQRISA
jgi:diguanylate cyclase (GGDEF)-like protein